ncbi:putative transcription-associated protein 1-like [Homarus americanus]|uniref:Putative transcription-associated protein 1-like n=1 Tax=Homarus americanus TaxID=6706 RepID=A0A8J5J9T8_HOMAM|nr:putative transcription-associated protein 1-like [Homarus americanus]
MKVLACVVMVMGMTQGASLSNPKASLSIKDKLALDLPLKYVSESTKAPTKLELVKVSFPSTTTTTTTTTPEPQRNTERPQYIDATVFRHQFTRPNTETEPPQPLVDGRSFDYEAHFRLWDDLSSFAGEMGPLGGDLRGEEYIVGFRPPGF